jgi:F-type H+-transporting ATPase subunit b
MLSPMRFVSCFLICGAALFAPLSVAFAQESGAAAPSAAKEHGEENLGHGNAGPGLEDAAEIKTDLAVYTLVVFLLLLAILGKFAWPSITHALEERERSIAANIAAAEAKHEEAKRLLAEHAAKLAATAGEIRAMLEEARREAEVAKGQIVAEAKHAAQDEANRAKRDIDQAKNAALQELAVTSANLAVDLARKVVQEQITPDRQARLVQEALGKLASATPSKN